MAATIFIKGKQRLNKARVLLAVIVIFSFTKGWIQPFINMV
jgi:hypothetical protein